MDKVKRKVLLDLFASPMTVLPVAVGLSAWMLSWAVDGSTMLNLAGLAGVLGGVGMLATRMIFGLEKITEDAFVYLNEQQRQKQEDALDALLSRLRRDRDSRTQKCLKQLRKLYSNFQTDVQEGRISGAAAPILEKVENLFRAAVKHLEHSYDLWEAAKDLSGDARRSLLGERDQVVEEIQATVQHLGKTIEQFHSFRVQESESELTKLRQELDESLRVARRAEERVAALGREKTYDPAEFE